MEYSIKITWINKMLVRVVLDLIPSSKVLTSSPLNEKYVIGMEEFH